MLAKQADRICVAYPGMEKFFPSAKIVYTGNPVRNDIEFNNRTKSEALKHFGLSDDRITLLVVGGSLGARTINHSIHAGLRSIADANLQLIWQTGKFYEVQAAKATIEYREKGLITMPFIKEMDLAYAAADIVVSRAGAIAISELCISGKPTILVPSPNVAEDHQTKNALALSTTGAAILVKDTDAPGILIKTVIELASKTDEQNKLSKNISLMAMRNSAGLIAAQVFEIAAKTKK